MANVVDRRKKNLIWYVTDESGQAYGSCTHGRDGAAVAVLMDIRDELKQLNSLLGCRNFVSLPNVLRQVRDNTRARAPHRRLPRNVPALELAAKDADDALDVATRERERVVSALTEAYRRAK